MVSGDSVGASGDGPGGLVWVVVVVRAAALLLPMLIIFVGAGAGAADRHLDHRHVSYSCRHACYRD